jgi:hypothetical protein
MSCSSAVAASKESITGSEDLQAERQIEGVRIQSDDGRVGRAQTAAASSGKLNGILRMLS